MSSRSRPEDAATGRVASTSAGTTTLARKRLGDILVEAGLVTRGQLEAALIRQRSERKRLGALLVEAGHLTSARLSQTLSYQLCIPWVSVVNLQVPEEVAALLPADVAHTSRALPVHLKRRHGDADVLYVATDDPTDEEALAACVVATGGTVRLVVTSADELDVALVRHYGEPRTAAAQAKRASGSFAATAPAAAVVIEPIGAPMSQLGARSTASLPRPPRLPDVELDLEVLDVEPDPTTPAPSEEPIRVVLVVSPSRELLRECRSAALPLGVLVVATDLAGLRAKVTEHAPLAIVVEDALYALDRVAFTTLALSSGSPLVIWSDELDRAYLEPVFATAVQRAER
ncbi:MAG: hypothetical protein IT379_29620 [Deltaproteobacteria bacterium]|nr:hypothetical protein [Deltaproteobacteria bacterium]